MNTKRKLLLATIVSLLAALCVLPATVLAAKPVAKVQGRVYMDYEKAWDAVKDGGTIEFLADWNIDTTLKVNIGAEVIMDMNSFTIDRGLAQKKDSEKDGAVLFLDTGSSVSINDGTLTGGCSDSGGSGVHMKAASTLNLINVKIKGNRSEAWIRNGHGGGVLLDGEGAQLNMYDSHINDNFAEEKGGGIYIADENDCSIFMNGTSTISNNEARDSHGGSIYINGDNAIIMGQLDETGNPLCSISGNKCDNDGGAIYVNGDNATIFGLNISNNTSDVDGGGIFVDKENCTVENCKISGNKTKTGSSREGGGIFVDNDGCNLISCNIINNYANDYGGGVYVTSTADIKITGNIIIKDNKAGGKRNNLYLNRFGASSAYVCGSPTSEAGSIGISIAKPEANDTITNDANDFGAYDPAVYFYDDHNFDVYMDYDSITDRGDCTMKLCDIGYEKPNPYVASIGEDQYVKASFALDQAEDGETVVMLRDWSISTSLIIKEDKNIILDMKGFTIDRGLAESENSEKDGAVLVLEQGSNLKIFNGTLTGGCSDSGGSGVHMKAASTLTLTDVTITGNRSEELGGDGHGGGVLLDGATAQLYMYDSHIKNNYAEEKGGGVYIADKKNCKIFMYGTSTISDNEASDSHGGGIYVNGDNAFIVGETDSMGNPLCSISGNKCDNDGGGIYVNDENVLIQNINISGNKADVDGGGIYVDKEKCTVDGCVITRNTTGGGTSREGGGVFVDNDDCTLKNCNITLNEADDNGGGVFVTYTVDINLSDNVVIKQNIADGKSDDLYLNVIGTTKAYIKDPSKITSEAGSIGIRSGKATDTRKLSADGGNFDETIFFSNDSKYKVVWNFNEETGEGDKLLKLRELSKLSEGTVETTEESNLPESTETTDSTSLDNDETTEAEESINTKCEGCGSEISEDAVKEAIDELLSSKVAEEDLNGFEGIVSVKCPDCGEYVNVNISAYPTLMYRVDELSGSTIGTGNVYALAAALIALAAAGGYVVIRRRKNKVS